MITQEVAIYIIEVFDKLIEILLMYMCRYIYIYYIEII